MFDIKLDSPDLGAYRGDIVFACKKALILLRESLETLRGGGDPEEQARRQTWFGNTSPWYIESRLQRIFDVIDDASRTATFVDARKKVSAMGFESGLKLRVTYKPTGPGQAIRASADPNPDYLSDADYAFVHPVPRGCFAPSKGPVAHVGSGLRMYLGSAFFSPKGGQIEQTQTIIHELSHKVLGTVDWDADGNIAYGVAKCQELARNNPAQALKVADNWAYYVTGLDHKWMK